MTKLAFVDTETTGLDPDRHEMWEIGLVLADSDDLSAVVEHEWLLPVDLSRADPMALRVTGLYERRHPGRPASDAGYRLRRGAWDTTVTAKQCAVDVARMLSGAHLVGAVPSFDAAFLARWLRANGQGPAWHYHLIDVEAMAVGYLAGGYPSYITDLPWRSDDLSDACGVPPPSEDERHTALGDARWCYRWYCALVGQATE